jgi:hypothetical protein
MPPRASARGNAPFPLTLDLEFVDRLAEPVRLGKAESVSAIIRAALARFDLAQVLVVRPAQIQISVRLPARIRQDLRKAARSKHTTVTQLVRAAVESYLPHLEEESAGQLQMPIPVEPTAAPPPKVHARPAKARSRSRKPAPKRTRSRPRRGMTKKRKG